MTMLRSLRFRFGLRLALALVVALEVANLVLAVVLHVAGVHDVARFAIPAGLVAPFVLVVDTRQALGPES